MNDTITLKLKEQSDEKYRDFTQKLTPTGRPVLGVRTPALRNLAKEAVKQDSWRELLAQPSEYLEQDMLKGMMIGYARLPLNDRLELIADFVPEIDNWAVCDAFCATLKFTRRNQEAVFKFIAPYTASALEFRARFGVVMLKNYFVTEEYIDRAIMQLAEFKSEAYYARMAKAWFICECIAKFEDKGMPLLLSADIDESTRKMAVRKCLDSYRVSQRAKDLLRG